MRYLFIVLLLAGCATHTLPPEDEVLAKIGSQCEKIGFAVESAEYKSCKLQLWQQYLADVNAAGRTASANRSAAATATMNKQRTCVPIGNGAISCN